MRNKIIIDVSRLLGFRLAAKAPDLAVLTGAKIGKSGGGPA
jgi:hypothetical protein